MPAEPSPTTTEPRLTHCQNCGRELEGSFCATCGQLGADRNLPLWNLIRELAGDLFGLDSRVLRTLPALLFRPGFLTAEYIAGRRVHYVPPLRLYIFVSFLFFVLLALGDRSVVRIHISDPKPADEAPASASAEAAEGGDQLLEEDEPPGEPAGFLEQRLEDLGERLNQMTPKQLNDAFIDRMAQGLFLLVPIFAMFLKLLYGRRWLYIQHFIYSLHVHAFIFIVQVFLSIVVMLTGKDPDWFKVPFMAVMAVYVFLSMRRVYGGLHRYILLRMVALGVLHSIALVLVLLALMVMTVYSQTSAV